MSRRVYGFVSHADAIAFAHRCAKRRGVRYRVRRFPGRYLTVWEVTPW